MWVNWIYPIAAFGLLFSALSGTEFPSRLTQSLSVSESDLSLPVTTQANHIDVHSSPNLVTQAGAPTAVKQIEFLGEVRFPTGYEYAGTEVGGLSSIAYDAERQLYYALSDDAAVKAPVRYYNLSIDVSDRQLTTGDVTFQGVTYLKGEAGTPPARTEIDPEGIAIAPNGNLFITSEGYANQLVPPFVHQFRLTGEFVARLPIPAKFLPTADRSQGIRPNLGFEEATISPDGQYLYTMTENALYQDGAAASLTEPSPARILRFDLARQVSDREMLYYTDAIASESVPPNEFKVAGVTDLLAIDNEGRFFALERSFAVGVGHTNKLYEVNLQAATDIRNYESIAGQSVPETAQKQLILDFAELGIPQDNLEGLTFGPNLPDGRKLLIIVSDNNFDQTQFTQFLAFAVQL